jgi:hypothetical integral membrane protein (TIGR02206 family)
VGAALSVLVRPARGRPAERAIRYGLAFLLLVLMAAAGALRLSEGPFQWTDYLPLDLCDIAVFVTAYALVTRSPLACELAYFWAFAGGSMAMLMPDLDTGFPSGRFLLFFTLHGLVIAAVMVLCLGVGCAPRRGAALRVFGVTNAYAVVVGIVDWLTGANYMYLRAKPFSGSILDAMGPWPVYILAADLLALVLFLVLEAPWRSRWRASGS